MSEEKLYKTKPLKSWGKAKELRENYYKRYVTIKEQGGIRWGGSAWTFDALPQGLGDDVANLTSEPYGAAIAANPKFARECFEAVEAKGYARDLCAYMRAYWGSVLLNKYAFDGPFPKPDFILQTGICCSHGKWYQQVSEFEGGIPYHALDVSVGPYDELTESKRKYLENQCYDSIDFMERVTGRKYDDERLIQAVYNECRGTSLWAEICHLNQAVPAPLDEKSMYSLYVLLSLQKSSKAFADFYEELRDEVKERVKEGIAAVPNERARVFTDSQPPWSFLKMYRYLEQYGVVSVGSIYTFALLGIWDLEYHDNGHVDFRPAVTPQQKGIVLKSREDAIRTYVDWNLKKVLWTNFYNVHAKTDYVISMVKDWKCDGVILHYNRGCEGTSLGIAENRLGLLKAGIPVVSYEGNMGDESEFDESSTLSRIDAFMESLNLKKMNLVGKF